MILDFGSHDNHCFALKTMVFYTFSSDPKAIDSATLESKALAALKPNALESTKQIYSFLV